MADRKKPAKKNPRASRAKNAPRVEILPPEGKRRPGRPKITYAPAVGKLICDMISGMIPLVTICEQEGMPSRDTVYRWLRENPEFDAMYARARERRATARSDNIDAIIQKLHMGEIDPQVARVIIDAEKWQMSKEQPRLYGDKVALTDPDGGALTVKITV